MEFRAENTTTLRAFRRSMLRYADDLNKRLSGIEPKELEKHTKFFINTEIVPVLDELQAAVNAPARAWWRRGWGSSRRPAERKKCCGGWAPGPRSP